MHVLIGRRAWMSLVAIGVALTVVDAASVAPGPELGRWKLDGSNCYWDEYDDGPDQCDPNAGRYKLGPTGCYWDPWDSGPDECSPTVGRWKWDGVTCYWDANDSGPHQCNPDSPPPNSPPTVTLTSPANGATFSMPATISLAASASDPEGYIVQLDFYAGTTLVGSDTSAPYTASWTVPEIGSYVLTATARDNAGATTTSAAVSISVGNEQTPAMSRSFDQDEVTAFAASNVGERYKCSIYGSAQDWHLEGSITIRDARGVTVASRSFSLYHAINLYADFTVTETMYSSLYFCDTRVLMYSAWGTQMYWDGGGPATQNIQVCGDDAGGLEKSRMKNEYIERSVIGWIPNCGDFASSGGTGNFSWSELNGHFQQGNPHNPWGIVRSALTTAWRPRGPTTIGAEFASNPVTAAHMGMRGCLTPSQTVFICSVGRPT